MRPGARSARREATLEPDGGKTGRERGTEPQTVTPERPRRTWLQKSQDYAGVIAIVGALTGLTGAATGVVGLIIASNANNLAAREDQQAASSAARAYASHVGYTAQLGPGSAPEIVISNPGDGLLSDLYVTTSIKGQTISCDMEQPGCLFGKSGPLLTGLPDISACEYETIRISQLNIPPIQAENDVAASDLYFTDPTGHSWVLPISTGDPSPDDYLLQFGATNPFAANLATRTHIPGCV